jgi:hypothetical protein
MYASRGSGKSYAKWQMGIQMAGEEVCTVRHDAEVPCVVMIWRGYATSAEFRAANERVLSVLAETRSTKLLGDVSHFVLIGMEDQAWLNTNWIPRAMAAGLRHVALIQPTYYFNKVAVETVGKNLDPERLSLSYFGDIASARDWLAAR